MKHRFWLFRRGRIFYVEDTLTRRQESLGTQSRREAEDLRAAKESAVCQPHANLAIGKAYLAAHDPQLVRRAWRAVMDDFVQRGQEHTHERKRRAMRRVPFRLIAAEHNEERRHYYELLWEIGAAQTDTSLLTAEHIDWERRVLQYQRRKTGEWACVQIGPRLELLLRQLPHTGPLFPQIAQSTDRARASEFCRRCRTVDVKGVSLHSYRYAWAERAKAAGYPERHAQNALGHNSRAVHAAYAKGVIAICPSLESYETKPGTSLLQ